MASTELQPDALTRKECTEPPIRPDILEAIRAAWPNGVVEMPSPLDLDFEDEDRYLAGVFEELRGGLSAIKGASIMYERESDGTSPEDSAGAPRMLWDDDDDDSWEMGGFDEPNASYHLFFLGLTDPKLKFETESEELVDHGEEPPDTQLVKGTGTVGCLVAVSLVAPLALIVPDQVEQYDDGSIPCPDIGPHVFHVNGGPVDMDEFIRVEHGQEAYDRICELRTEITTVLESVKIAVLPKDEAEKPIPWLKSEEAAWIGKENTGDETRVRHAFFFRGIY